MATTPEFISILRDIKNRIYPEVLTAKKILAFNNNGEDTLENIKLKIPTQNEGWQSTTSGVLASGDTVAVDDMIVGTGAEWYNIGSIIVTKNTMLEVESIEDLVSQIEVVDISASVNVRGYYTSNDSGGGIFNYDATIDKSTANGGTIIDPSVSLALQGTGVGLGCWARQYSGAVSSSWFGVKTDGSDGKVELLRLASYVSDGCVVDFGSGVISSSVQIPWSSSNITLVGSAEIKALTSGGNISGGLFNFTDVDDIVIDGLTFTVDGVNDASLLYFSMSTNLENVNINNCVFNFTGWQAINHAGAGFAMSNFKVDNCEFYGDGTAVAMWYEFGGLVFDRGYTPLIVSRCYFDNCLTALQTSGTGLIKDTRFIDNKVHNCQGKPIFMYHSVDTFISGNTFDTYALPAWFEQKCIITNNLFRNSAGDGVVLYNADKVFSGNSVYNNAGNGLVLSLALRNCLVQGNNIYENDLNGVRVSAEPRGDSWTGSSRIYDIDLKSNLIKSNGLNGIYLDDIHKDGITFGNGIEQVSITNNTIERNGVADEALAVPLNDAYGILLKEFGDTTVNTKYNITGNIITLSTSATGVQGNQYNAIFINDRATSVDKSINVNSNELKANSLGIAFKNNKTYGVKTVTNNTITGLLDISFLGVSISSGNVITDKTATSMSPFLNITVGWDTGAPVSGTYTQGSIVYDRAPLAGANIGWVCTVAGTPGTWKAFGTIEA